ncbi:hypothetical protein [Actinosynnema mirum]|uniref:Aminoglycoside phosphotransferase n=1 Tax=Actinosynnema mirum (strain ATCC 29888 / DSM 43827 / JCM 3225 / NBRC 14064 / NCIMB 13271 / NRRL B-12336 / IMRU 3971 / 101) TaxID=446462 RepID=C6WLJ8_ACTMD|nr:hypothetical protein [Actinosynnema mirum]ACU38391.1 hypothetical protein Amir_4551 [Actinosynnema mirum DSM 43827]
MDETDQADEQFRRWLRQALGRAAGRFGLVLGEVPPRYGWRLRSAGVPALDARGTRCWLRVGTGLERWVRAPVVGAFWTGIPDSRAVRGVPRPRVLAGMEWSTTDWTRGGQRRCVRADATTLLAGRACSADDELRAPPAMPERWWAALRRGVTAITRTSTSRFACRAGTGVREVFGERVAAAFAPVGFATQHGDLHWANLIGPDCALLDWELWGVAPVGTDAATLYLFALRVPETAERVWAQFADVLDTAAGHTALVHVASRILRHAGHGRYPELAPLVLERVRPLIAARGLG